MGIVAINNWKKEMCRFELAHELANPLYIEYRSVNKP